MDTHVQRSPRALETRPIAPSLFAHFVLRSSNMDGMIDWYRTVLGMHIVQRTDYICFLTYDDEHHRVAIVNQPGLHAPDEQTQGLSHVAYTLPDIGALVSTYARLKPLGIVPYLPIHHGPTLSMYYRDPDGNAVELQVDVYATKAETAGYFQTDAFKRNPIGVRFDPDRLVADWQAGVSEAELLRMPEGPPVQPRRPPAA